VRAEVHTRADLLDALVEFDDRGIAVVSLGAQVYCYVDVHGRMWHFDVTKGYEIAREHGYLRSVFVEDLGGTVVLRARYRELDEEQIARADVREPCLFVWWDEAGTQPPGFMLIDGSHRAVRASETGTPIIPAWIVPTRALMEACVRAVASRELTGQLLKEGF
jgi:hypothetical protein